MFISVLELFKIGIGPSSSHTMGPMVAAKEFMGHVCNTISEYQDMENMSVSCTLKGSLAFTGKGHATDRAVALGLHGYSPEDVAGQDVDALIEEIWKKHSIAINETHSVKFSPSEDIIFDKGDPLPEHPNGMIFELKGQSGQTLLTETYFSIFNN